MTLGRGVICYYDVQIIMTKNDGSEVGIYKIEGAAQELFDRAVLLFSRVTTEYEDDESWDVQMTVEYRTGTTPDWVKIQIVDIGGGDDDVEVIATIRMARIDTYGG